MNDEINNWINKVITEKSRKDDGWFLYYVYEYNKKYNKEYPLEYFTVFNTESKVSVKDNNMLSISNTIIGVSAKEVAEYMFNNNINISQLEKITEEYEADKEKWRKQMSNIKPKFNWKHFNRKVNKLKNKIETLTEVEAKNTLSDAYDSWAKTTLELYRTQGVYDMEENNE